MRRMNMLMVKRLILKDWYLQRWTIGGCVAAGLLAVALIGSGSEGLFYAGFVLLVTVLITVGINLAMATVLLERKEQTLAFVMSLPISAREYTTAKILGTLLMFLIPWVTLVVASVATILGRDTLPDGLIPVTLIILTEIFVSTCVLLGVALVSESQGWTIGTLIASNLFLNFFLYSVFHIPAIAQAAKGTAVLWSGPVTALLLGEVATIALVLVVTFVLQDRKTDFI
jgi:ABC-2 type transport system permease protein